MPPSSRADDTRLMQPGDWITLLLMLAVTNGISFYLWMSPGQSAPPDGDVPASGGFSSVTTLLWLGANALVIAVMASNIARRNRLVRLAQRYGFSLTQKPAPRPVQQLMGDSLIASLFSPGVFENLLQGVWQDYAFFSVDYTCPGGKDPILRTLVGIRVPASTAPDFAMLERTTPRPSGGYVEGPAPGSMDLDYSVLAHAGQSAPAVPEAFLKHLARIPDLNVEYRQQLLLFFYSNETIPAAHHTAFLDSFLGLAKTLEQPA